MDVWTVNAKCEADKSGREATGGVHLRMKEQAGRRGDGSEKKEEEGEEKEGETEGRRRSAQTQTECCGHESLDDCRQIFSQRKWSEFGNVTTLHGMRYITHSNYSLARRVLWAAILLSFITVLVCVVVDNTIRYLNFNVTSLVTVKYVNDLVFPAVTICNYNLLRKSYAQSTFNETVLELFNVLEPVSEEGALNRSSLLRDWNLTADFIRGAHQVRDMVVDCTWRSTHKCSAENFTQVLTDFGTCYTLNDASNASEALVVKQTGYDSGLYLRLNLEQYDYFFGISKGAGFKIMLHKQGEYPFVKQLGFSVSPGFETLVTLKFTQLVNMKKPYVTECVPEDWIDGYRYTVETCQALCKAKLLAELCGCRTSDLPAGPDLMHLEFCTYGKFHECVRPALRKQSFQAAIDTQCNCSVPCFREVFTPRISEVFWPAEHISQAVEEAFNSSQSFLRKNIIDVVIFFEELNYEEIRQIAAYTFTDLLSDVGGYMGLMVGASLITFLEFVDFVLMGLVEYCRRRKLFGRSSKIKPAESRAR